MDNTEEKTLEEFFVSVPPGKSVFVSNPGVAGAYPPGMGVIKLQRPQLRLHCTSAECDGVRHFITQNELHLRQDISNDVFITYQCRNCGKIFKVYAIYALYNAKTNKWVMSKYGEIPTFGPPTPSRAFNLIGGERDLFLLGRRNENQGMGIGAFVYYRRVIESQKNRIFDELIRVIEKINPGDAVLVELEAAKKETQFTKAVEVVKHALPDSLRINGHNPLTLLHSALSEGVHNHSDAECLELASSIRTVLFEFAERLGQALKEEAELNDAVKRLTKKKPSQ